MRRPIIQGASSRADAEHVPRLRRFARGLTGDALAADDLVRIALADDERAADGLLAGLRAVAETARRQPHLPPLTLEPGDRHAGVHAAMDCLTLEQRAVAMLVMVEQLTYGQTAIVLGLREAQALRILAQVRAVLDDTLPAQTGMTRPNAEAKTRGAHLRLVT